MTRSSTRILLIMTLTVAACATPSHGAPAMSDQNKAVVRKFVEEFKNRGNHDIVDEVYTADFAHHFKDPRLPPGRAAMKLLGKSVVAAFPDVHATIEDLLVDGDRVIERTVAGGTSKGPFNGVPPTGKPVQWTEIHIYRLKDGKIAELWSEIDFLAILAQLGALPPPKP
jgi:predicted SnoaL-like aldol condensation-catalyzing enzyme